MKTSAAFAPLREEQCLNCDHHLRRRRNESIRCDTIRAEHGQSQIENRQSYLFSVLTGFTTKTRGPQCVGRRA